MDAIAKSTKSPWPVLLAVLLAGAGIAVVVLAVDFIMLLFLASLFGVFLTKTSNLLKSRIPLGYSGSLAVITVALVLLGTGTLVVFGVKIESQVSQANKQLDASVVRLEKWLRQHPTAYSMFKKVPYANEVLMGEDEESGQGQGDQNSRSGSGRQNAEAEEAAQEETQGAAQAASNSQDDSAQDWPTLAYGESSDIGGGSLSSSTAADEFGLSKGVLKSGAGKVFSVLQKMVNTTLGMVANLGVIFFIGLFLAVNPQLYRDGFAKVFPIDRRKRVVEVMDRMGTAMFNWLNGRFLAMLITGAGTAIALFFLGVPMALTVGVLTGLLTFIPNIGAVISLSIAMLMGLSQSPAIALWVLVLYAVLQLVESNVITPLVQQHKTSIPPAMLISFQLIMGALTGFLGILIATPLLAASLVLVRELWIKDALGDESVAVQDS